MNVLDFFSSCLQNATDVIVKVKPSDYENPTPCRDWNVRQLANHMLYELSWIPEIVEGLTIDDVGEKYNGDLIKGDLKDIWLAAASKASTTVLNADLGATVHLSFADVTNEQYLWQVSGELFIHSWDLSVGINSAIIFNNDLAQILYDRVKPRSKDMYKTGLFDPVIKTDDNEDIQTKLLAVFGRKR